MKRLFALTLCLILLLPIVSSCDAEDLVQLDPLSTGDRYKTEAEADPYSTMAMFKDTRYYYYILTLGVLRNVPLDNPNSHNYTGDKRSLTITISDLTEETISTMISDAEQKCTSGTASVNVGAESGLGINAGYLSAARMLRLDAGFALTTSSTTTRTKSITSTKNYATTHTESINIDMQGKQTGYYRYVLMADLKVYVAVVYDTETDTYEYSTYSTILGQGYVLDYSPTLSFDSPVTETLDFDFDRTKFDGVVPTKELTPSKEYSYIPEPINYDSGYERKKIDASNQYRYDTFDISPYKAYMNPLFKISFHIEIQMEEENAGIQEIYLFSDNEQVANKDIEYGGSGSAKKEKGWETINFTVTGDKCTDNMHLEYGAHGDSSDDWIRYHAKVTVTVEVA